MSDLYNDLLEMPHSLWTIGHVYDPFLAFFVFGNPFLALAISGIWEIAEYLTFKIFGDYSFIFLNDPVEEALYDVIILDIGGTLTGTLLAACLTYVLEEKFTPENSPWKSSKGYYGAFKVLAWFLFRAVLTMPLSGFGWECNEAIDLCTSSGYHLIPWGLFLIWIINGTYTWLIFEGRKRNLLLFGLFVIGAPALQRGVPSAYILSVIYGPLSILIFIFCGIHKFSKKRNDYKPININ